MPSRLRATFVTPTFASVYFSLHLQVSLSRCLGSPRRHDDSEGENMLLDFYVELTRSLPVLFLYLSYYNISEFEISLQT